MLGQMRFLADRVKLLHLDERAPSLSCGDAHAGLDISIAVLLRLGDMLR
jgi:hypothetical protein